MIAKDTAENKPVSFYVSNKRKYYTFLFGVTLFVLPACTPWVMLNYTFSSIQNENNMNLDSDQKANYLSLLTSSYYFGNIIGSILAAKLANTNLTNTLTVLIII